MIHTWQMIGGHLDKFTQDDWLSVFMLVLVIIVLIGVSILKDSVSIDRQGPPPTGVA